MAVRIEVITILFTVDTLLFTAPDGAWEWVWVSAALFIADFTAVTVPDLAMVGAVASVVSMIHSILHGDGAVTVAFGAAVYGAQASMVAVTMAAITVAVTADVIQEVITHVLAEELKTLMAEAAEIITVLAEEVATVADQVR